MLLFTQHSINTQFTLQFCCFSQQQERDKSEKDPIFWSQMKISNQHTAVSKMTKTLLLVTYIGISLTRSNAFLIHPLTSHTLVAPSNNRSNPLTKPQQKNFYSSTVLSLSNQSNNNDGNDEDTTNNEDSENNPSSFKNSIKKSYKKAVTKVIKLIPSLKIAISSFTVGIVLAFTLIFIPVYKSVDTMSEPVTLFETILTDLDQGYVDAVDTKKLFETGVSAMLNSLDPYTEFEGRQEAKDMSEGISGKYAGVGLVISGASLPQDVVDKMNTSESSTSSSGVDVSSQQNQGSKLLPKDAMEDNVRFLNEDISTGVNTILDDGEDLLSGSDEDFDREAYVKQKMEEKRATQKAYERGIRVVSAFEGYAFDAGMRPGDKIVAVDGLRFTPGTPVESVRSKLRGEPGTSVDITFERDGIDGETTLSIPRNIVQVPDVKLTSFVGKPQDGIGYIQLTGFAANAGNEVRRSIFALQRASEEASNGEHSLQVSVLTL